MSKPPSRPRKQVPHPPKPGAHRQYVLRLYMAGNGPNSQKALANLRSVCQEYMNGNCRIETINVVKDFQAAVRENILITPALVVVAPRPRVVVLGNLSDRPKLLQALGLREGGA